ncbi:MAG: type II toxin-antitoxin system HicB family antitoxin [Acidobacteria bacterium]|nr:type II toxin-antitoxin system HicB family antitoxin [Acidobacteriota bacterium]
MTVQVEARREGDVWVATCPALDVASHGDTREESYRMLEEALAGFFEDCCEHETLLAVLAERGLAPTASMVSVKPPTRRKASDWLSIPVWLVPNAAVREAAVR